MKLRPYQVDSIDAVDRWLRDQADIQQPRSGVLAAPTGSGKTILFASLLSRWFDHWGDSLRALILVPQRELATQAETKIRRQFERAGLQTSVGVCCASAGRFEVDADVTIASPFTLRNRLDELVASGRIRVVIVDEAHLVGSADDAALPSLLSRLGELHRKLRVIGFTATPYRLDLGLIYGANRPFDELIHQVPMRPLIDAGHLSKVVPFAGEARACIGSENARRIRVQGGDFQLCDLEREAEELVDAAVADMISKAADRSTILVFAISVSHAAAVLAALRDRGQRAELVTGRTPTTERETILDTFTHGRIRWLVNVACLTTGVDVPNIDCVVSLRPTLSTGLWLQMVGRGTRSAEGKSNCLLLDYSGNTERHGPIDDPSIEPSRGGRVRRNDRKKARECGSLACSAIFSLRLGSCPECGWTPSYRANHATEAGSGDPLRDSAKPVRSVEAWVKRAPREPAKLIVKFGLQDYSTAFAAVELEAWRIPDPRLGWRTDRAVQLYERMTGRPAPRLVSDIEDHVGFDALASEIEERVRAVTVKGNFVSRVRLHPNVPAGVA